MQVDAALLEKSFKIKTKTRRFQPQRGKPAKIAPSIPLKPKEQPVPVARPNTLPKASVLQPCRLAAGSVIQGQSSPEPATTFIGIPMLSDPDGSYHWPPDTNGAAGRNHLMETASPIILVTDLDGGNWEWMTVTTFWDEGDQGIFDTRVAYDSISDRFILVSLMNSRSSSSSLLVGISKSADPTGDWACMTLPSSILASGANRWLDFPAIGFSADKLIITANGVGLDQSTPGCATTVVLYKEFFYEAPYEGAVWSISDETEWNVCPAMSYTWEVETAFLVSDNGAQGLNLFTLEGDIQKDFGKPVLTKIATLPLPTYSNNGGNFAPQRDASTLIDTGDARMESAVYRNGSLWFAHTVFLPSGGSPTRSAVQWGEVDISATTLTQSGFVDDPGGPMYYAYPSIAVNANEDVLIGFSCFSADQFAAAGYAFRSAADPAGSMRGVNQFKAGEHSYVLLGADGRNRWGDVSSTMLDPTTGLFFWTAQEYADHLYRKDPSVDCWGTCLAKVAPPIPAVALCASNGQRNELQIMTVAKQDRSVYLAAWQEHDTGTWHPGAVRLSVGGLPFLPDLVAGQGDDKNLQLLGLGVDNYLHLVAWQEHSTGKWHSSEWFNPQVELSPSLAIGLGDHNNLQVLGVGLDHYIYLAAWQEASSGTWHPGAGTKNPLIQFKSLPLAAGWGDIARGSVSAANLQVLGLGLNDNLVYLACWQNGLTGEWFYEGPGAALKNKNVKFASLVAVPGDGMNLQVMGVGLNDHLVYLACWQERSTGQWHEGVSTPKNPDLAVIPSSLVMAQGDSHNLQVLGLGRSDNRVYLVCYQESATGTWRIPDDRSPKSSIPFSALSIGMGDDDNLQVLGIGRDDGLVYLACWQDRSTGTWHQGRSTPLNG
jgi:hypothetical protein